MWVGDFWASLVLCCPVKRRKRVRVHHPYYLSVCSQKVGKKSFIISKKGLFGRESRYIRTRDIDGRCKKKGNV